MEGNMTNRQPKGTPVGGQFAEGRKPDGGDLVDDRDIATRDYMNSFSAPANGARTPRKGKEVHLVAVYNSETKTWSLEPEMLSRDQVVYDTDAETWESFDEELDDEAAAAFYRMTNPVVYISPDGNWGGADGLLLLSQSDIDKVGDLSELYEEHGDDLIDAVRERLNPPLKPELVLQYRDWHDVAEAVGNLTDAWNSTRNSAPEMDEAMSRLHFSYDTPHDEMVKRIVAAQEAWRTTSFEGYDDPMLKVDQAVEALGDFLTSPEPEAS